VAGERRRHGEGIPRDQIDLIFEKFHRVEDPQVMTILSTGLGLFIAQRLARAMGGDVSVRSTLGKGSVFTLRLPDTSNEPMRDVTIR